MKKQITEYVEVIKSEDTAILDNFHFSSIGKTRFRAVRMLIELLSRGIGLDVVYRIPKILKNYPPEAWEVLPFFGKLRKLSIAESFAFIENSYADEPRSFMTRVGLQLEGKNTKIGFSGVSRDLLDRKLTLWPALGEAVERWALETYRPLPSEIRKTSYENLRDFKMDIFKIAGFGQEVRQRGHKYFNLSYTEKTPFTWVKGYSLTEERDTWIPLQLVSFTHGRFLKKTKEPLLSPLVSTGAAAGQDLKQAITAGLLEVIERDAYMIYWLNKLSPDIIDLESIPDPRFKEFVRIANRYKLEVHLQYLKTDIPVHIVGVYIVDRTGIGPAVSVGAATSFDLIDAAYKVVSSTLAARQALRRMCEDRREEYVKLNPYELGHAERTLYYAQVENIEKTEFLALGKVRTYEEILSETKNNILTLTDLVGFFRRKGYQVIYKEILEKKIQNALKPFTVVMVRVPELQPLHLEEVLPANSGARLSEVLHVLDKSPASFINTDPHPFP